MALYIEGFERFAKGVVPFVEAVNGGSPTYDATGWRLSSGSAANNDSGTVEIVDSTGSPGVDRGLGLKIEYNHTGTNNGNPAFAAFALPDNSWTKMVIGFHLYVDPNKTGANNWQWLLQACNATRNSSYSTLSVAYNSALNLMCINYPNIQFAIPLDKRMHVELYYDKTTGEFSVYIDGTKKATYPSNVSGDMNNFASWAIWWASYNQSVRPLVFDDFYILNDIGGDTVQTLGPCKVDMALPVSTSHAGFTPNAAVTGNYESVGDVPINDSTYVSSDVIGAYDLHGFDNPLTGISEIDVVAVQATTLAKSSDGTGKLTSGIKIGTASAKSNPTVLPIAGSIVRATAWKNPTTGAALTVADLSSLESGYEVGDSFDA